MNILLCGMKHCGKSTQGRLLARKLGARFIDLDLEVERMYFATTNGRRAGCREIYREHGEEYFRKLEAAAIAGLMEFPPENAVISLGGGTVSNPFLPKDWKTLGKVVYLKASPLVLYSRIEKRGLPPYLAQTDDPAAKFRRICEEREADFERAADLVFDLDMQASSADNSEELYRALTVENKE